MNDRSEQARVGERGFTLLLAALIASITLSLGAAIYSIAYKQVTLSAIGRDSQFAFYAGDTLAECALYSDLQLNLFPTSTPTGTIPGAFHCNGASGNIDVLSNTDAGTASCNFFAVSGGDGGACGGSNGFEFIVPSSFSSMIVSVYAGGGGGGSSRQSVSIPGKPGTDGGASSFDAVNPVSADGGTAGGQGFGGTRGSDGANGMGQNGDSNLQCPSDVGCAGGGQGGGQGTSIAPGGNGGNGGVGIKTYTEASLPGGTVVNVTVGPAGNGGASSGSNSAAGSPGNAGHIHIEWGAYNQWVSTTFSFELELDGKCARGTLVKEKVSNTVRTTIHADGLNVSCSTQLTDPHALQRSVELRY